MKPMNNKGDIIIALRKEKGISQAELAKAINVSSSTLCRWEKNQRNPSSEDITAMAEFLGVSVDAFYEDSESVETEPEVSSDECGLTVQKPNDRWNKKKTALVCITVMAVLLAVLLLIWFYNHNAYALLGENRVLSESGELECDLHYLLPKHYSKKAVDRFIDKKDEELSRNPDYADIKILKLFFYETVRDYEVDDAFLISIVYREDL